MVPFPKFDQISIISDLHMGGPAGHQIFRLGGLLGKFVDYLGQAGTGKRALVINGDMVDFLAEENAMYFDPEGAIEKLNRMRADAAFAPAWDALVRYTNTGARHLAITLGNHDLELALPWVRERLLDILSGGDSAARARITLAFDGTGFACEVGGDRVLCVHGNEVDTWNVTDYEALRRLTVDRMQKGSAPVWTPNAGSKLVIDVMNKIKGCHAFVDILKPEKEAALRILYALKPDLKSKLTSIAAIATRRVWDEGRRAVRLLSDAPGGEQPAEEEYFRMAGRAAQNSADVETLMDRAEELFKAGKNPLDMVHERESERLGWWGELVSTAFRGEPHEIAWSGVKEMANDTTFQVRRVDDDFEKIDAMAARDFKYVVAGHTHLARALGRRNGGGLYYNTGTWATLMRLGREDLRSAESFEPVFRRLQEAQTIPDLGNLAFARPTVATIRAGNGQTESDLRKVIETDGRIGFVDVGDEQ
ncbi:MAG: metallophosphoesterase [Bryobacteraceae bacterium]|jgi:UDP-2,3-diacylglucosamine pyrophosphatase LpxH